MGSETALATFLTNVGSVVTAITGFFADVLELFSNEPILLLPLGIFVIGAVIGLVSRMIRAA